MNRKHAEIIGNSANLAVALAQLSRLAPINRPALILGERGTGKEMIAERLHYLSPRWQQPLLKVNCAAISDDLLESELFGHEAGAFTGASRGHHGRFERADGGTLFLDELATMSTRLQEKLLRLIEYGEFERLGGQQTLQVDVRVVAATNADLRRGNFRQDLLDRLSFDVVHLPPLRYRRDDIADLAQHFAIKMCQELDWELFPGFTEAAMQTLLGHDWPGNIRELKNAVERSVYRWEPPQDPVADIILDPFESPYAEIVENTDTEEQEPTLAMPAATNFTEQVQQCELRLLTSALRQHHHHQRLTAEALGLSYHQLRGLLRKHQLSGAH
jgi:psp operon transcriptional activator